MAKRTPKPASELKPFRVWALEHDGEVTAIYPPSMKCARFETFPWLQLVRLECREVGRRAILAANKRAKGAKNAK